MKTKLQKSIICDSLDMFMLVLKKLDSMNYHDGRSGQVGSKLFSYGMSEYHWNIGIRVINLYDDKTTKYAANDKNLKNVIKAIDFLKS